MWARNKAIAMNILLLDINFLTSTLSDLKEFQKCSLTIKRGWDKSPSLSIVFGLSSKTQWLSGLYYADFISFTALLNCAEVGRRNRILTNYRFLSHSPSLDWQVFLINLVSCSISLVENEDSHSSHSRNDNWDIRFNRSQRRVP